MIEYSNDKDCHRVRVSLALAAINSASPDSARFAITSHTINSLPSMWLHPDKTLDYTIKTLYQCVTGSSADWFVIRQVKTSVKDRIVDILYAIMMPETVPLIYENYKWIDFNELSQTPELLLAFGYACNAYKTI